MRTGSSSDGVLRAMSAHSELSIPHAGIGSPRSRASAISETVSAPPAESPATAIRAGSNAAGTDQVAVHGEDVLVGGREREPWRQAVVGATTRAPVPSARRAVPRRAHLASPLE